MKKSTMVGCGLLLVGILAGAGGAHALQVLQNTRLVNTGQFSLASGETVRFHATLQDRRDGAPARVQLRLLDRLGGIVVRRDVSLAAGQSATLEYAQPGVYRAQAQAFEPDGTASLTRILLGTVEIFGPAEPYSLDLTTPRRFVCSHDDGGSNGRLPD